jgi:hypothetical protein
LGAVDKRKSDFQIEQTKDMHHRNIFISYTDIVYSYADAKAECAFSYSHDFIEWPYTGFDW